mmetsp:Transcript_17464/g.22752  ORF Transcript_17464/g.22752 Transcript_17464/m.22752 type:complete len:98 (+) Transcript_17464:51-344(+)
MSRLFVLMSLLVGAVAFTAPHTCLVNSRVVMNAAPKEAEFDTSAVAKVAALAPLLAVAPAGAFTADYLPPILVPVMTLFLPAMAMALGFILTQKEDL